MKREELNTGNIVVYKNCLFKIFIHPKGKTQHDEIFQDRLDGTCEQIPLDEININELKIITTK